ncbi:MAG: L,D-transpeptidase [Acidobacteriia bacterium]|nr:L,D-transpeptidase [Terriglobia bacterium]
MRRSWVLAGLALVSLGFCAAASYPVLSGRTEPPRFTLDSAGRALAEARRARADRWARDAMFAAESAMRVALTEQRRQEVRFFLLRDFSTARASLSVAEDKARKASAEAVLRRDDSRAAADAAMTRAGEELGRAEDCADAMHLGVFGRALLQKAKIAYTESKILYGAGEYPTAADRAETARTHALRVGDEAASAAARFTDARMVATWKHMADDTVAWSRETGSPAVVVYKENHRLTVFQGGRPVRSYAVELGYNSTRDKIHSGDAATPEGRYRITAKKGQGNSTYYKALLLNYPNEEDRAQFERARRGGQLPRWARMGGLIEIHGDGGRGKDWTKGCLALANPDIDDLFKRVGVGTPVTIVGGDGNGGAYTELVRRHRAPLNGTVSQ